MRTRTVPDGMRCIICHVQARGGVITHTRTCADHRRTDTPGSTTVNLGDLLRRKR